MFDIRHVFLYEEEVCVRDSFVWYWTLLYA